METERPIKIAPQREIALPLMTLIAMILATASVVFGYSKLTQSDERTAAALKAAEARVDEHEQRIRSLESSFVRIEAKLDAIKDALDTEREARRAGR